MDLYKRKIRSGNTTSDQMVGKQFKQEFDRIFGKRCIKHPAEVMPCKKCNDHRTNDT